MAPESHPLGKTSTSSAWARHEWAPHFSIDKNSTLSSTDSQTLRTQWFGDTLAIPLDKSNTFRASRLSGTTNTVLSEAASSKMLDIDFDRQNKYFQRSPKSLNFLARQNKYFKRCFLPKHRENQRLSGSCFGSTKLVLRAPSHSQALRIQWFQRLGAFRSINILLSAPAKAQLEASERRNHYVCRAKRFS